MPSIPRYSGAQVDPRNAPSVRTGTYDTGQQALAQGAENLGKAVFSIGLQEREKADTAALMEYENQLAGVENDLFNNPQTGVYAKRGKDAFGVQDQVWPEWDKRTGMAMDALPDRLRGRATQLTTGRRTDAQRGLMRHVLNETETYSAQQEKGMQASAVNAATLNYLDPARIETEAARAMLAAEASAQRLGVDENTRSLLLADSASSVYQAVIERRMTDDPIAAREYYEANRSRLTGPAQAALEEKFRPLVDDVQARADARWANTGDAVPMERVELAEVQSTYESLGNKHGFRTTSITRSKEENDRVGGAANSQHLESNGTARDWSVKGKTPEQIEAFASELRGAGFHVITEPHGTGPHIHAQLPRGKRAAAAPAPTLVDALERVQSIEDPRRRANAEREVRREWTMKEAREQEGDRAVGESINEAIWSGDPNRSLVQVLGPDAYNHAVRKGWVKGLEADLEYRRHGKVRVDVPDVVGPYLSAMRADPEGFAKMDVGRNARHMAPETVKELLRVQDDIRAGKGSHSYATENEQLNALVFGPLKMTGETAAAKALRAPFETAWYGMKREFAKTHPGRDPTNEEREVMLKRLAKSFALNEVSGYGSATVPDAARVQILAAFANAGKPAPDEKTIRRMYLTRGNL